MKEILDAISLKKELEYIDESFHEVFLKKAGIEHYRFLNHICKGKKLVYDIGSYMGASAVAMCSAEKVVSYDIEPLVWFVAQKKENIEFRDDSPLTLGLLEAQIILIDISHDGIFEKEILDYLDLINYKGLVILDDILYFSPLTDLWNAILRKKEIVDYGHYTGTGLIYYE